jgi:hypothetical protein
MDELELRISMLELAIRQLHQAEHHDAKFMATEAVAVAETFLRFVKAKDKT